MGHARADAAAQLKETLLGADAPEQLTVHLPWSGSRLIGGGRQIEVTRGEVHDLLVEGFFPRVPLDAKPVAAGSGFQEFGLPFAADAAVTRYLAAFLSAHRHVAMADVAGDRRVHDPARPDIVLFNGGLFYSPALAAADVRRLAGLVRRASGGWQPVVLDNDRLDLAVARGAAYYGMVRRGQGVRIAAGLARTYYIGVERRRKAEAEGGGGRTETENSGGAVCLAPAGIEPGHDIDLTQRRFDLLVSEPVEFPLYVSSTRLTDRAGRPGAVRPRADHAAAADPDRAAGAEEGRGGNGFRPSPRPAHGDRHVGPLVQRVRRPAKLATAIRRPLGHANRRGRPPAGGRARRVRR